MEYPAPRRHRAKPDGPKGSDGPKVFLPYYAEPPPVEYGREWTIGLVDEPRRNLMARVLDFLVDVLPGRGWKLQWHSGGLDARYLEKGHMRLRIGRKWFEVGFSTPGLRDEAGRRRRMAPWAGHRVRISSERDLGDAFLVRLAELLDQAEDLVNRLTR